MLSSPLNARTSCFFHFQVSARTGDVELTKLLTLKQYLNIYSEIKRHVSDTSDAAAEPECTANTSTANTLDASVIMMQYVVCNLAVCVGVILCS